MTSEVSPATSASLADPTPTSPAPVVTEEKLPQLSPADFRLYNNLAELMEYYHNHFRATWTTLHTATTTSTRPSGMSIRQFLNLGLQFIRQLTLHHNIEEVHVFPMLAAKMPKFRAQDHLRKQHEEIHHGLDQLEAYLEACRDGSRELRLPELGEILNGFGGVLWAHLDDEVNELRAENMRKFWTREEMRRLNF